MSPGDGNAVGKRVLVVDGDDVARRFLLGLLTEASYECVAAEDERDALGLLGELPFEAAIVDGGGPGESRLDLLQRIALDHPDVALIVTAHLDDPALSEHALAAGAYGLVVKPFEAGEMLVGLANALRRRELELWQRAYVDGLDSTVNGLQSVGHVIADVEGGEAREPDEAGMARLMRAIVMRNDETIGHLTRVGEYAALIGRGVGLGPGEADDLRRAALLHDIGKLGVPDAILLKPGPLTRDERAVMQRHARLGYQLLGGGRSDVLRMAADIALNHHESWDGGGYPRGRRGEEIPVSARIVAIADTFDALTSDRAYRTAAPLEVAIEVVKTERGRRFEPRLVDAFVGEIDPIRAVRRNFPDVVDERIRVLVVDDEEILRDSVIRLLGADPSIWVVGAAATVAEATAAARALEPDVVLMDLVLPDGDGAEATAQILSERPQTKVVMLTGRTDAQALVSAISVGCCGFVTKAESVEKLTSAIAAAYAGEIPAELKEMPRLLAALPATRRGLGSALSTRELEILGLMSSGLVNKQIARLLSLSLNTVRNHVQSVLGKLEAHSKLEAVAVAVREGVIPPPTASRWGT